MKIVLLGVSLESDNRGVNALGLGAIDLIHSKYGNANIQVVTISDRQYSVNQLVQIGNSLIDVKITYFTKRDFLRANILISIGAEMGNLINVIKNCDLVLDVNEGDSYSDIYGYKRFFRHFLDTRLGLKLKKDVIFLPQTLGPFSKKITKYLAAKQLARLKMVYVRDEKAVDFLVWHKINYQKHIDLAVFMTAKKTSMSLPVGECVGININGLMYLSSYKSLKNQFPHYKDFINSLVTSFSKRNVNVLLIPHTYNAVKPIFEDDLVAITEVLRNLGLQNVHMINVNLDAQELKYIISKCEFFIGSRMHSCIAALSSGVPTVGVAYSYKFEGTFSNFEMKDHVINMAGELQNTSDEILKKIFSHYEHKDKTRIVLSNTKKLLSRPII